MNTMQKRLKPIAYACLCIGFAIVYFSCNTTKTTTTKHNYLEGLYRTEKMPADIGEPYRGYLKFKKDGTVMIMNSSLECDTVNKIIENGYAQVSNYSLITNDSIKFTFVNNRVNNQEYTAKYIGVISKEKSLKFTVMTIRKGGKPYKEIESYTYCH